jgi:diacylglycerol O-acyltransferase
MDPMNPLDVEFLYLEDGTAHMHVGSCSTFEGPAPSYEELAERIRVKLPLVPRYRQHVKFVPFDLRRPFWVDDPNFSLDYHVRHTALPPPGGKAELCRLMGRLMSQELDRARPLWETWMVEGLAGGRWAVISKVHHCMVDGIAGVDLMSVVLDPTPDPAPVAVDEWEPAPEPSALRLAIDGAVNIVASPREQLGAAWRALRDPRRALAQGWTIAAGLLSYGSALLPTPPTSLDGIIGPHRRWTYAANASLADVRTIRHALGGTVNDVVLAAVTSAFRDLVLARGEDPDHVALRTLVPVSLRAPTGDGVLDNQVSAIFFDLPISVGDPLERLTAVHEEMDRLKRSHEAEAGQALTQLAGAVPPALMAQGTRLASRLVGRLPQRTMNTVTTNVPGPQVPLYLAGREMLDYLPYVPIGPGVRIGVAILSYNGQLHFAVTGDYDTAPDIGVLADGIDAAIGTLRSLAEDGTAEPGGDRTDAVEPTRARRPARRGA